MKLGYVAFDNWANYTLWLQMSALREDLDSILAARAGPARSWRPRRAACWRRSCRRTATCGGHGPAASGWRCTARPMRRWKRSRPSGSATAPHYGITVDRSVGYMRWRVNDDPHVEHGYLTVHGDDGLLGYAIAFVQGDTLHVVDVLVDGARTELFRDLFAAMIRWGRDLGVTRIKCLVLRRSVLLPRRLRSAGFVDTSALAPGALLRKPPPRQFFVYIPKELRGDPAVTDNANWYITALVLEGLPRPT